MATFRKVHTSFWGDEFIQELTPEQKYFYLYLLTNERTKQCGIYEITKRQMSFDTGYNIETIEKLIELFYTKGRIIYNNETKELAMKNWDKYNGSESPKVLSCIRKELDNVKDRSLIVYVYSIDTETQEEKEEEKEKEEEEVKDYKVIFLNLIEPFINELGDSYDEFVDYWCESSKNGKLRYQSEKFFDVKRRIGTWLKNKKTYGNTKNNTPFSASQKRMAALQEFING